MKTNQLSNWLESKFLPTDGNHYNFKQHEGIRTVLFRNLCIALEATKAISINDSNDNTLYYSLQDPYRIWFEIDSVWDTLSHALPTNAGEKLCHLSVAGLINAMSGMDGGVVDSSCCSSLSAEEDVLALTSYSLREIKEVASLLHETIVSLCCVDGNHQSAVEKQHNSMDSDYCYYSSEDESDSSSHFRVRNSSSICKACDNTKEYLLVFDTQKGGLTCTSCGGSIACDAIQTSKQQPHYYEGGFHQYQTGIYQQ